jgi:ABC-type transport system substrate-binding protein
MGQIYQSDLAQIGFDVTLKPTGGAAFSEMQNNSDFGMMFILFNIGHLSPATGVTGMAMTPQRNLSGFNDEAYTQLVNQIVTETDPVKQKQLYSQLNDIYLDQSWVLPIIPNPERAVARSNVHGLRYDARPGLALSEVWLS